MEDPETEKNELEEYEQYLRTLPNPRGRKLTLSEKCGLAWALRKGEKITVVCDAFGLSRATASWLKHCLTPDAKHYAEIYRELQRLGPDEFQRRYFMPLIGRLARGRLNLPHLDENQTDRAPKFDAPDPNAKKYAGPVTLPDGSQWVIDFRKEIDPPGWYFGDEKGAWHGEERLRGAEGHEPFTTGSKAFDAIYELNQFDNPRPKPGRPKK